MHEALRSAGMPSDIIGRFLPRVIAMRIDAGPFSALLTLWLSMMAAVGLFPENRLTAFHIKLMMDRIERSVPAPQVEVIEYGDERDLLNATLPILEALHCWVNGKSFSFQDSHEIARKNAQALWKACKFNLSA